MRIPCNFEFNRPFEEFNAKEEDYLVRISPHIDTKISLLRHYAELLKMPDYFGENWDALDECMRDLHWIPNKRVIIYHADLPLVNSPQDNSVYINLLSSWVEEWKNSPDHELIVTFPSLFQNQVISIMSHRNI